MTLGVLFGVLGSCWLLAGCEGCLGWPGWLARGIPGSRQCAQVRGTGWFWGLLSTIKQSALISLNHLTVYPHAINMYTCIHSDYTSDIQTVYPQHPRAAWWPPGGPADDGKRLDSLSRAGRCMAIKKLTWGEGLERGGEKVGPDPPDS